MGLENVSGLVKPIFHLLQDYGMYLFAPPLRGTEEPKIFKCSFCDKTFQRRANALRHEKLHTGEKPFVCPLCGRGFITKANLMYHLERSQEHANDRSNPIY